jgi:hypothetical protein
MKACDARTTKYSELLEKYGDTDQAEAKIAAEMGWDGGPGDLDDRDDRISVEEINAICEAAANAPEPEPEPHREGIDWVRTPRGEVVHPLEHRCFESAMKLWHAADELERGRHEDPDLDQCVFEFQTTAAKLAGALNGLARGGPSPDAAFTVAYLKRALDHLHKSQAGLEAAAPKRLLPDAVIAEARAELLAIREGILALMDEFRGRRPSG